MASAVKADNLTASPARARLLASWTGREPSRVASTLQTLAPEILRTIAAPWSVSTLYAFVYCAALVRGRKAAP